MKHPLHLNMIFIYFYQTHRSSLYLFHINLQGHNILISHTSGKFSDCETETTMIRLWKMESIPNILWLFMEVNWYKFISFYFWNSYDVMWVNYWILVAFCGEIKFYMFCVIRFEHFMSCCGFLKDPHRRSIEFIYWCM